MRGWCCSRDSLLRDDDPDPQATVDRVVAALSEWQRFLVDLAATFDELYLETGDLPLADQVERAAARLLPVIVARTGAEDAWYSTFSRVVVWCLESFGHRELRVLDVVDRVVRGHFESWCAPDPGAAQEACADLGRAVLEAWRGSDGHPDALAAWLKIRGQALRDAPAEREREPVRRETMMPLHAIVGVLPARQMRAPVALEKLVTLVD